MRFPKVSVYLWSILSMTPTSPLLCPPPHIHRSSPGTFPAGSPGIIKIGTILLQPCMKTGPSSMPCACGSCNRSPPTWRFTMASGQHGTTTRESIARASTVSSPGGDRNQLTDGCGDLVGQQVGDSDEPTVVQTLGKDLHGCIMVGSSPTDRSVSGQSGQLP